MLQKSHQDRLLPDNFTIFLRPQGRSWCNSWIVIKYLNGVPKIFDDLSKINWSLLGLVLKGDIDVGDSLHCHQQIVRILVGNQFVHLWWQLKVTIVGHDRGFYNRLYRYHRNLLWSNQIVGIWITLKLCQFSDIFELHFRAKIWNFRKGILRRISWPLNSHVLIDFISATSLRLI